MWERAAALRQEQESPDYAATAKGRARASAQGQLREGRQIGV